MCPPVHWAPAAELRGRVQPVEAQELGAQHVIVGAAALLPGLGIPVGLIRCLGPVQQGVALEPGRVCSAGDESVTVDGRSCWPACTQLAQGLEIDFLGSQSPCRACMAHCMTLSHGYMHVKDVRSM